jgi:hypothetical protein
MKKTQNSEEEEDVLRYTCFRRSVNNFPSTPNAVQALKLTYERDKSAEGTN